MKNLLFTLAVATSAAVTVMGAGCSAENDPQPPTAQDAAVPGSDVAPDAGGTGGGSVAPASDADLAFTEAPRCGDPPYQAMWLAAQDLMGPPDARDLRDVTLTFKHCPQSRFMTGPDGRVLVMVSREAETWVRFEKAGYLPWMVGEVAVTESLPRAPLVATMVPAQIGGSVLPAYRSTDSLVYLQVQMGRRDAPESCRSPEGVVITVKGHPEAQVSYRTIGSNGDYVKASATTVEGVAIIGGLGPSVAAVEIAALKPGCDYDMAYGDVNSAMLLPILRTPLSPGTITHQVANPAR